PHRGVPGVEDFHLRPAYRNPASTPPSLHCLSELRLLSSVLDRARRDSEPIRYFFVCALQRTQLLQFRQIDLHRPAPLVSYFSHLNVLLSVFYAVRARLVLVSIALTFHTIPITRAYRLIHPCAQKNSCHPDQITHLLGC